MYKLTLISITFLLRIGQILLYQATCEVWLCRVDRTYDPRSLTIQTAQASLV